MAASPRTALLQETSAELCRSSLAGKEPLRYALLTPPRGTDGATVVGRATALQPLNATAALRWQRYFQLDGSALELDIDMAAAAEVVIISYVAPAAEPPFSSPAPLQPEQQAGAATADDGSAPSCSASSLPSSAPAAAIAHPSPTSHQQELQPPVTVVALDLSVPAFLQVVAPTCPAPAPLAAQAEVPNYGSHLGDTSLPAALAALLPAPLQSQRGVLGLTAACALELLAIAALLLRRRDPGRGAAAEGGQGSSPSSPQRRAKQLRASPPSLRRTLCDACCSPMVPAALLSSAVKAVRQSPAVARLFAIPEGSTTGKPESGSAAAQDAAALDAGWARRVCLHLLSACMHAGQWPFPLLLCLQALCRLAWLNIQPPAVLRRDGHGRLARQMLDPSSNLLQLHPGPFGSASKPAGGGGQLRWVQEL